MTLFGTDTAFSVKDAAALAAAGAVFSYPRVVSEASDGSVDPSFAGMAQADRNAGRAMGGYDFLTKGIAGGSVALHHAQLFVQAVAPYANAGPFIVVLDLEDSAYRPKADWADIRTWCGYVHANLPACTIWIYAGAYHVIAGEPGDWAADLGVSVHWILPAYPVRPSSPLADIGAFYASVGGDGSAWWNRTRGGQGVAMWQFAGTVTVAGQGVDLDAVRGSIDELVALTSAGGQPAAPEVVTELPPGWQAILKAGSIIRGEPHIDPANVEVAGLPASIAWPIIRRVRGGLDPQTGLDTWFQNPDTGFYTAEGNVLDFITPGSPAPDPDPASTPAPDPAPLPDPTSGPAPAPDVRDPRLDPTEENLHHPRLSHAAESLATNVVEQLTSELTKEQP